MTRCKGDIVIELRNWRSQFRSGVRSTVDPQRDASTGCILRQVHDRYTKRIPQELVQKRKTCQKWPRSLAQLLRRRCQPTVVCLAQERMDTPRRSARLVSMVLPILYWPPNAARRPSTD